MRILVTGGAGFIGSHFVRTFYNTWGAELIVFDALTYAACDTFKDLPVTFIKGNVRDPRKVLSTLRRHKITHVVHMAAETHVDNSISDPEAFIRTNIIGTFNLMEAVRLLKKQIERVVYVSTDEVYGSVLEGMSSEFDPLEPSSPYSASKAAGEMVCSGHFVTYGLPIIVTRGSNTFGPRQHEEKLIPKTVKHIMSGAAVPVYGNGLHMRDWMSVDDHVQGIWKVLHDGIPGATYNIGARNVMTNLQMVEVIRAIVCLEGGPEGVISRVADRPGHDARYAVNPGKLEKMGWRSSAFDLRPTVKQLMMQ